MSKQSQDEVLARLQALKRKAAESPTTSKATVEQKTEVDELELAKQKTKEAMGVASKAMGDAGSRLLASAKSKAEEAKRVLEQKREAYLAKQQQEQLKAKYESEALVADQARDHRSVEHHGYIEPGSDGFDEQSEQISAGLVRTDAPAHKKWKFGRRTKVIAASITSALIVAGVAAWLLPSMKLGVVTPIDQPAVAVAEEQDQQATQSVEVIQAEPALEVPVPIYEPVVDAPQPAVATVEVAKKTDDQKVERTEQPARATHQAKSNSDKEVQRAQEKGKESDSKPTWQDEANSELDRLEKLLN